MPKDFVQNLYIQRQGQGVPVVFLHGFLESSTMWTGILPHLTNCENITIDLPGHGKSGLGEIQSIKEIAEAIKAALTDLEIHNPIVIGHSLGGYVGLELLKITSLKHLVLFHSNFWEDSDEKRHNRNRVIDVVQKNKKVFINEAIPNLFWSENQAKYQPEINVLKQEAMDIDVQNIIELTKMLRDRKNNSKIVEENHQSVTMIHGLNDPIITNEKLSLELSKLKQKPNLIEVEGCGHMGHFEQKEIVSTVFQKIIE